MAVQARRHRVRRLLSSRRRRWVAVGAAAALVCAVIGLSIGLATSSSATATAPRGRQRRPPAVSDPAAADPTLAPDRPRAEQSGTVASVSTSSFTTVDLSGSEGDRRRGLLHDIPEGHDLDLGGCHHHGEPVLVLGTTNGTTITATQVTLQPTGGGSAPSSAASVVPFQQGAPTTSKQVGQIPANFSQGSGTIVSGTAANQATEAALAAYPGGVVDRVVQLSNGEYNVHYIGVNWPHHIFVNQAFQVVGAE